MILLQECWKFMSLKFKIYSILTDECGQRRQHMFKMCSIKRVRVPVLSPLALPMMCSPAACSSMKTSIFGVVDYVIRMATPSTARDCRPCRKSCTHAPPSQTFERNWLCAPSSHHISAHMRSDQVRWFLG